VVPMRGRRLALADGSAGLAGSDDDDARALARVGFCWPGLGSSGAGVVQQRMTLAACCHCAHAAVTRVSCVTRARTAGRINVPVRTWPAAVARSVCLLTDRRHGRGFFLRAARGQAQGLPALGPHALGPPFSGVERVVVYAGSDGLARWGLPVSGPGRQADHAGRLAHGRRGPHRAGGATRRPGASAAAARRGARVHGDRLNPGKLLVRFKEAESARELRPSLSLMPLPGERLVKPLPFAAVPRRR
jgi:hypothetical protein